jgi:hypothetical protein
VFSIAVVALHSDFGIHEGKTAALCVKPELLQLPLQDQVMVAHQKSLHCEDADAEPSPNATQSGRPPSVNPSPATLVRWSNACAQPARRDESWFASPEACCSPQDSTLAVEASVANSLRRATECGDGRRDLYLRLSVPLERPALWRKGLPA